MTDSIQSILILLFFVDMAIMLGVGGRLLYTAAHTRRAPEAAIGTSAAFGALGVILALVATSVLDRDPSAFPLWALGRVIAAIGVGGLALGSWRIYRPDDTSAAVSAAVVCAIAATGCAMQTMPGSIPAPGHASWALLFSVVASLCAYGWASVEAFHYHVQMKRRLALGLADPVITQQFRLWGISGVCAAATTLTNSFVIFWLGRALQSMPATFVAVQLALFVATVCLWLAFYPPGFYRRRLSSRASA